MYARRLKILLLVLALATIALAARALQIQVIQSPYWRSQASKMMISPDLTETTRGTIRDCHGRVLALDAPCIDACVDYRAITQEPDAQWLALQAEKNLQTRLGETYAKIRRTSQWAALLQHEIATVRFQIADMWAALARVSGKSPDDINDIRQAIVQKVEMRRRWAWWRNYENAGQSDDPDSQSWYNRFLEDIPGQGQDIDKFALDIKAQFQPQVILPAIDLDQQAQLARRMDQYPGLSLCPSTHREYPYGPSACHLIGHLALVSKAQINAFQGDELNKYWPNDLIGCGGVEEMCEQALRGRRGEIRKISGTDQLVSCVDPQPGKDVRLTVDIELQAEIEQAFARRRLHVDDQGNVEIRQDQHGAAVVIDVPTGNVLALVSNPGFDPNMLDVDFPSLSRDDINLPLLNRATQMALEPGSTIKTILGCGSITDGTMTPQSTIECTGYLVLHGHRVPGAAACWVVHQFGDILGKNVAHHPVPWNDPHPTGFLTISDGLQRSCNVVFETIADRMGMPRLVYWFDQFGLGRKTGIGIEESPGLIPQPVDPGDNPALRIWTWDAGIGQGRVHATPLQMANVAATIARNGIWLRPRLLAHEDESLAADSTGRPDRVDLHLAPDALAAVRDGMLRVTSTIAGTGLDILPEKQEPPIANDPLSGIQICGKTGSAQAPIMTIPHRDSSGRIVASAPRDRVELGTPGTTTWYIGGGKDQFAHAWYIGFAPAQHPQVAFCVMVEYGWAGGRVAGAIAHDTLEACCRHGYLVPSR